MGFRRSRFIVFISFGTALFSLGCGGAGEDTGIRPPGSIGEQCNDDSECGDEQICGEEGVCVGILSCVDDQDCSASQHCDEGMCMAVPSCHEGYECPEGFKCSADPATSCIPEDECRAEGDCEAGTFCSSADVCIADNTCLSRNDCATNMKCVDFACVPDDTCGGTSETIDPVDPRTLILFDRSCSMVSKTKRIVNPTTGEKEYKWEVGLRAMQRLIDAPSLEDRMEWGLQFFPQARPQGSEHRNNNTRCAMDDTLFPIGTDPATLVSELESAKNENDFHFPGWPCVTNLNVATYVAGKDPAFDNSLNDFEGINNVILVTDGKQERCGGEVPLDAADYLEALVERNIRTFVVGFGTGSSSSELEALATAGQPSGVNLGYFSAESEAELDEALNQITNLITSCEVPLVDPPADPSLMSVFLNDTEPLVKDDPHGWSYHIEPTIIPGRLRYYVRLLGNACVRWSTGDMNNDGVVSEAEQNTARDLDIVYGCGGPSGG